MDLSKILNLLYRYLWLLVLAALIAGLITFFFICGKREITHRNALRRVTKFRISAEITDDNYFVERHT